jgi:hypothetical protein
MSWNLQCSAPQQDPMAAGGGDTGPAQSLLAATSAMLLVLGAVVLQPHGALADAPGLRGFWSGAILMGAGFVASWRLKTLKPALFWGVAIAARLILIGMEPGGDMWRYLWEGQIQLHGYSPFHHAPDAPVLEALRPAWWERINHRDTAAIYPPLTQLLFRLLAAVRPGVTLFKVAFVLGDLAICGLLSRCFGPVRACLYGWNPLVIYSFSGGGHYDSLFLLAVVGAWLVEDGPIGRRWRRPWRWSALLLGISVALKWVSLPMLAFQIWRALRRGLPLRALQISLLGALPLLLAALPFCGLDSCPLIPLDSSFVSHGRNADLIPHLLARIWPSSHDSNAIPGLLVVIATGILVLRARSIDRFAQIYWPMLLLLSPILHPWYFTWWIPFGVPDGNWGTRLISLSGFACFPLPATPPDWALSGPQRLLLWLPPLLGWLVSRAGRKRGERDDLGAERSDPA